MTRAADTIDVIVVGGGPSGLAAATELAERGPAERGPTGRIVVLEREDEVGGVPRHCDHYPFGAREHHRVTRGPAYARALLARALAAGVEIRTGTSVMALHTGSRLTLASTAGVEEIAARRVLLATGVRESSRIARHVGGSKPAGVVSTGALQGLVHLAGVCPFERPVILGSELVSFSAIGTCRGAGIRPVAMIEPGPRAIARWPAPLYPALLGIPFHVGTDVVAVEGRERVEAVLLRGSDGAERRVETDGLIVSGRFVPEATLVRASHLAVDAATGGPEVDQYGRCSDPDWFATGNLVRAAESAGWSWREGRAVGRAIGASLAGTLPPREGGLRVRVRGEPLKLVVPQRLVARTAEPALAALQLRVSARARGDLVLRLDGETILSRRVSTLPERRLSVPLSALPAGIEDRAGGALEISIEPRR